MEASTRVDCLREAYETIHNKKTPEDLKDWEIAERIVEVLDDPDWVKIELARECIQEIVNGNIRYPGREKQIEIVLAAEDAARKVFPELSHIDEVHMADIERAYAVKTGKYTQ